MELDRMLEIDLGDGREIIAVEGLAVAVCTFTVF